MKHLFSKLIGACLLGASLVAPAVAAQVTYNESKMDEIFAQADIDVRFLPTVTLNNASLLTLDSEAEWNDLMDSFSQAPTVKAVGAFFVDAINWCGSTGPGIVGCAGGWWMALDSEYLASNANSFLVLAHELGHNLGLGHISDPANLMYPYTSGSATNDDLSSSQISTIQSASPVQIDAAGKMYVQIQPFLVAAVPEPTAWLLFLAGLPVAGFVARRRRSLNG